MDFGFKIQSYCQCTYTYVMLLLYVYFIIVICIFYYYGLLLKSCFDKFLALCSVAHIHMSICICLAILMVELSEDCFHNPVLLHPQISNGGV